MKKLFLLGSLSFFLASCSINVLNNLQVENAISFELLKQEVYGGRDAESNVVIRSQSQLEGLYKELGWKDIPSVDFSKNNVVAVFMGQKPTGGFSISVRKVTVDGDTALVEVYRSSPEGMATMALTAPYTIVVIPKTDNVEVR